MSLSNRRAIARRAQRLLDSGLVPADQTVSLVHAKTQYSKGPAQWHILGNADCQIKKIREERTITLTDLAALGTTTHIEDLKDFVASLPADTAAKAPVVVEEPGEDTLLTRHWCWCVDDYTALPKQLGWSAYEIEAYRRWGNLTLELSREKPSLRHDLGNALEELDEEYKAEKTGEHIVDRIPALHESVRAAAYSLLWDEAVAEGEKHAPRLAEKARRAAQRAEECAAAEAAGLRYIAQPWGTLIDTLHELVEAGVPVEMVGGCLAPLVEAAEAIDASGAGGEDFHPFMLGGPRHGRPQNLSEGAQLFLDELRDLTVNAPRGRHSGRWKHLPHMMPFGHPMHHPMFGHRGF